MVFNIRLSMANFSTKPERNCLLIADTILISKDKIEVMTKENLKTYAEISYQIEDNEDDIPEEEKTENSKVASKKTKSEIIDTSTIIKGGMGVI